MRIIDKTQACGRLALAEENAARDLSSLLDKWVQKHFIKKTSSQSLAVLRSSGALPSLLTWLRSRESASDVLAIIRKIDKHNKDILSSGQGQMIAHIEKLASGLAPVSKPRPPAKAKRDASRKAA